MRNESAPDEDLPWCGFTRLIVTESIMERIIGLGFWHLRRRGWIILDFFLSAVSILIAYRMQPGFAFGWISSSEKQLSPLQAGIVYPFFVFVSMHVAGLHDPLGNRRRWFLLLRVGVAVAAALALCLLVLYFISLEQIGRSILIRTMILSVGFLGGARMSLWSLANTAPRRIGCFLKGPAMARLVGLVGRNELPFELVSVPTIGAQLTPVDVAEFFGSVKVEEVLVGSDVGEGEFWLACLNRGIQVTDVAVFVEREYYKIPCDDISLAWFISIDLQWSHPFYHRIKRVFDVLAAGLGFLLSTPIVIIAALGILIESGRPVFYGQTRTGFRNRSYRILKLRTMRKDAEKEGVQWAKREDCRVTKVGRVLRRTRIDELPQFWNVLKGEMSMIGPRPERPEFVGKLASLIPLYNQRHWTKPGITGWAQINFPYGASIEDAREKLCFDLFYLKNASLLLDMHIALRTLGALMRGSR